MIEGEREEGRGISVQNGLMSNSKATVSGQFYGGYNTAPGGCGIDLLLVLSGEFNVDMPCL